MPMPSTDAKPTFELDFKAFSEEIAGRLILVDTSFAMMKPFKQLVDEGCFVTGVHEILIVNCVMKELRRLVHTTKKKELHKKPAARSGLKSLERLLEIDVARIDPMVGRRTPKADNEILGTITFSLPWSDIVLLSNDKGIKKNTAGLEQMTGSGKMLTVYNLSGDGSLLRIRPSDYHEDERRRANCSGIASVDKEIVKVTERPPSTKVDWEVQAVQPQARKSEQTARSRIQSQQRKRNSFFFYGLMFLIGSLPLRLLDEYVQKEMIAPPNESLLTSVARSEQATDRKKISVSADLRRIGVLFDFSDLTPLQLFVLTELEGKSLQAFKFACSARVEAQFSKASEKQKEQVLESLTMQTWVRFRDHVREIKSVGKEQIFSPNEVAATFVQFIESDPRITGDRGAEKQQEAYQEFGWLEDQYNKNIKIAETTANQ